MTKTRQSETKIFEAMINTDDTETSKLKSGITPKKDECFINEIEAELQTTGFDAFSKMFSGIKKFTAAVFGFKKKAFWVITNKRVIEVYEQFVFYFFSTGRQVKFIFLSDIKKIGYIKKSLFGFLPPSYYVFYESSVQTAKMKLKKEADEAEALRIAETFYDAMIEERT